MKKKLIAAGAASLAVAAMPVVGVFAVDNITDTVRITVNPSCSITSNHDGDDPANTYTATIANGQMNDNITGSQFTISCNDTAGWYLTAVGAQTDGDVNRMVASTNSSDDFASLATPNIAVGASDSNWAFKVAGSTNVVVDGGYNAFKQVPATAATVAHGTRPSSSETVTATYGVAIDDTQAAATYTGKVKYTVGHPYTAPNSGN